MEISSRNILVNSILAFVSAFILTTIIHEFGHYFAYWFFGADPILFHNYVQTTGPDISLPERVISALAGPLFSLAQGIIFTLIVSRSHKNTATNLVFLWMSLLGFINFFGYLAMTPLFTMGDTGKAAELLGLGYPVRIIIAIAGIAFLIWLIMRGGSRFSNFIQAGLNAKEKSKYVYRVMFFPIMIGSVINVFLALPVVAILSIIYPATSSYTVMSSFGSILKAPTPNTGPSEIEMKIKKSLIILALSAIVLNRLLTMGVG